VEGWLDIRINARHKIRSSSSKAVQYHNRSEEGWKLEGILYSEEGWKLEGILYSEEGWKLEGILYSEEGWKLEGILYSEEGWELEGILYSEVADRTCRCMLNIFFCI